MSILLETGITLLFCSIAMEETNSYSNWNTGSGSHTAHTNKLKFTRITVSIFLIKYMKAHCKNDLFYHKVPMKCLLYQNENGAATMWYLLLCFLSGKR